jgi:DNA-directed RNA polymerase specialized sigma24 family protein
MWPVQRLQRDSFSATLVGWLYRSMRYAVLARLRQERRRRARETKAVKQLESDPEPAPDWHCVRSVLDEALDGLKDEERDATRSVPFPNHPY